MRAALVTFLACFLGMLAALLVFHQYRKHEEAQIEAARDAQLQARIEQGRKLAEQTLAEQTAAQAMRSDSAVLGMLKTVISEAYLISGRMPGSNAEAGLPAAESYRGQSLQSAEVLQGGIIQLRFDVHSGVEGGVVQLRPDLGEIESMGIQWHCETGDYPQVSRALTGCAYQPAAKNPPTISP